jgi:hypothetical protein
MGRRNFSFYSCDFFYFLHQQFEEAKVSKPSTRITALKEKNSELTVRKVKERTRFLTNRT